MRRGSNSDDRWNYALSFSLPLFCLSAASSLKTEVHLNWTAPAFLSLLPAATKVFQNVMENASRRSANWWRAGASISLGLCAAAIVMGLTSLTWGIPRLYEQADGWRSLAAAVEAAEDKLEGESGLEPFV